MNVNTVNVRILFFAKAKEITGKVNDFLEVSTHIKYLELFDKVVTHYSLEDIKNNIILSLNGEYCEADSFLTLTPSDEIAVIPPLSEELTNLVASASCGAISVFIGTTRDNFENRKVERLEYEAYESMCMKCLENLCHEIRKLWSSVENIAIYHRLGVVPVKEASIIIATSSPHRADAMKATEWCIDNVKKLLPVWKKEIYADMEPQWKENKECTWSSNHLES